MRELALHILDVARNSIDAGAQTVRLTVTERVEEDSLELEVRDDGPGMDAELARRATDPFVTTRTTRRVGLGLPLLKATCQRCGGDLSVDSSPGKGTTVRATMRLGCIDRPPLGDIGAAVQALACAAPHTSVHYRHVAGGGLFEISTDELQAQLEDVPLTDPAVLRWIRDYCNEQVRGLGGNA